MEDDELRNAKRDTNGTRKNYNGKMTEVRNEKRHNALNVGERNRRFDMKTFQLHISLKTYHWFSKNPTNSDTRELIFPRISYVEVSSGQ